MNCIELMIQEHKNIKRMLAVMRKYCYKILKHEDVEYEDFFSMIDFVKNYADKHHHGKEEDLLFNKMKKIDTPAETIVDGMLIEHDFGRMHMHELKDAVNKVLKGDDEAKLDVIANAVSYTHLLYRHIDKEDQVVYEYAKNNLDENVTKKLNKECEQIENNANDKNIQEKYKDMIVKFESKV